MNRRRFLALLPSLAALAVLAPLAARLGPVRHEHKTMTLYRPLVLRDNDVVHNCHIIVAHDGPAFIVAGKNISVTNCFFEMRRS